MRIPEKGDLSDSQRNIWHQENELSVILPPKWERSWQSQGRTLVLETGISGKFLRQ